MPQCERSTKATFSDGGEDLLEIEDALRISQRQMLLSCLRPSIREIAMIPVHIGGAVVVAELLRRLGNGKKTAYRRGRATDTEIAAYTEASQALADVRSLTAVEPLIRALRDRNAEIRRTVASVLGEIGDKKAVAPLVQALKDKDSSVRSSAATALGKIGDAQAVEPLNAALVVSRIFGC